MSYSAVTGWHILGAGSLGCLWAARLAQAKLNPCLIVRSAQRLTAYQGQITFNRSQTSNSLAIAVPAELATASNQPILRLIVACKAYDALAAVESVRHRLTPESSIILLQNGLGSQQSIIQQFPEQRIIAASTTEGAFLTAPYQVTWAGKGLTQLGDLKQPQSAAPNWLAEWQQASIDCQWTHEIWQTLWQKLAINCAINPLTVIHQCKNGGLQQHAQQVNALIPELSQLLNAAGFVVNNAELQALIWQVIQRTAENTSSMRQDVLQQRRTETDFISGFACQQATDWQLDLPHLQHLHQQLLQYIKPL